MTDPVRPLHVRVAEALGYGTLSPCDSEDWHFAPGQGSEYNEAFSWIWRDVFDYGDRHTCPHGSHYAPSYDTDWAATGPLIERFKIAVWPARHGSDGRSEWRATSTVETKYEPGEAKDALTGLSFAGNIHHYEGIADTPLEAVCGVILSLHSAGKLNP